MYKKLKKVLTKPESFTIIKTTKEQRLKISRNCRQSVRK